MMKRVLRQNIVTAIYVSIALVGDVYLAFGQDNQPTPAHESQSNLCSGSSGQQTPCDASALAAIQHATPLSIEQTPAYHSIIQPLLSELEKRVPDLAGELRDMLAEKKWHFTTAPVPNLGAATNGTPLSVRQIAMQSRATGDIWMDQEWFNSRPPQEQAGIILHELGVKLMLRSQQQSDLISEGRLDSFSRREILYHYGHSSRLDMDGVREFTSLLLTNHLPAAERLQREIAELNVGQYMTADQVRDFARWQNEILRDMSHHCSSINRNSSPLSGPLRTGPLRDFSMIFLNLEDQIHDFDNPAHQVREARAQINLADTMIRRYQTVFYQSLSRASLNHLSWGTFQIGIYRNRSQKDPKGERTIRISPQDFQSGQIMRTCEFAQQQLNRVNAQLATQTDKAIRVADFMEAPIPPNPARAAQ